MRHPITARGTPGPGSCSGWSRILWPIRQPHTISAMIRPIAGPRPVSGTIPPAPCPDRRRIARVAPRTRVFSATLTRSAGIPPYDRAADSGITSVTECEPGGWPMLSNKTRAPSALFDDMKTSEFSTSRSHVTGMDGSRGPERVFSAFDAFLDRMPAWIFHALGGLTALISLWFALAFLGGLPRGIVEWITLAMLGGFAYAIGFMIPLVLAYLIETRSRLLMATLVVGSGAAFGVMTLPLPL